MEGTYLLVGVLMGTWACTIGAHFGGCQPPGRYRGSFYTPFQRHYYVGTKVKYICNNGAIITKDSAERECLQSGSWSREAPNCRGKCNFPSTPSHGLVYANPPQKKTFSIDEWVIYRCDKGYYLDGDSSVYCKANGWTHAPTCKRGCYLPSTPSHGSVHANPPQKKTFSIDEWVIYRCDKGYYLDGDSSVYCKANGWTHVPTCKKVVRSIPKCFLPPNPQFGKVVTNFPSSKIEFKEGEHVQYVCDSGYQVDGDGRVGCFGGRWSYVPQCRPITRDNPLEEQHHHHDDVTCPHRQAPVNGEYVQDKFKKIWRPGDIARYRCKPNYALIGHDYTDCRDDGSWRFKVPKCRRGCKRPLAPEFGRVYSKPENKVMFGAGEVIFYECQLGYKLRGESKVRCQDKGWVNTPTCEKTVTCPHRYAPINGVYIQDVNKRQWYVGDIARYRCNRGYTMDGHSYVDCLADGTWRFDVPTCTKSYAEHW